MFTTHMNTFYFNGVKIIQKFSSELQVPNPPLKLFHLEIFGLYGILIKAKFNDEKHYGKLRPCESTKFHNLRKLSHHIIL